MRIVWKTRDRDEKRGEKKETEGETDWMDKDIYSPIPGLLGTALLAPIRFPLLAGNSGTPPKLLLLLLLLLFGFVEPNTSKSPSKLFDGCFVCAVIGDLLLAVRMPIGWPSVPCIPIGWPTDACCIPIGWPTAGLGWLLNRFWLDSEEAKEVKSANGSLVLLCVDPPRLGELMTRGTWYNRDICYHTIILDLVRSAVYDKKKNKDLFLLLLLL